MSIAESQQQKHIEETEPEQLPTISPERAQIQRETVHEIAAMLQRQVTSKATVGDDGVSAVWLSMSDSNGSASARTEVAEDRSVVAAAFFAYQKLFRDCDLLSLHVLSSTTRATVHHYEDGRSEKLVEVCVQCKNPNGSIVELHGFGATEVKATLDAIQSHLQGKKPLPRSF